MLKIKRNIINDVKRILEKENELSFEYFFKKQTFKKFKIESKFGFYLNLLYRIGSYLKFLLKNIRFDNVVKLHKSSDIVFLAGSLNQYNSLSSTFKNLASNNSVTLIYSDNLKDSIEFKESFPIKFSIKIAIYSILINLVRFIKLWFYLLKENKSLRSNLQRFFLIHVWLVYAWFILTKINPRFLVISNDHNSINRCFLSMAHYLGVTTIYMQHASVSNLFPALRCNFAFLDGKASLEIYEQCENNLISYPDDYHPKPVIYLNGQKKQIEKSKKIEESSIGIAINSLDCLSSVKIVCKQILISGYNIFLRWHPGQNESNMLKSFADLNKFKKHIHFSNPLKQSLSEYFSNFRILVSGDSSIHLEAAIANVHTIYYNFGNQKFNDYYKYVQNGFSVKANSPEEVLSLHKKFNTKDEFDLKKISAVQYYSETFGTKWENREGELSSNIILSLLENRISEEFYSIENNIYPKVFRLK